MLRDWLWPKLLQTYGYWDFYFQQDGAPAYTAKTVQNWLKSKFGQRFVTKEMWPPRSPDLNPCDFYLWGYLRSKIDSPKPQNIDDLKVNIEREIRSIKPEVLISTFQNLEKRLKKVIDVNGGHIEDK